MRVIIGDTSSLDCSSCKASCPLIAVPHIGLELLCAVESRHSAAVPRTSARSGGR